MSTKEQEFQKEIRALCKKYGAYFFADDGGCYYPEDHPSPCVALNDEDGYFHISDLMEDNYCRKKKKK